MKFILVYLSNFYYVVLWSTSVVSFLFSSPDILSSILFIISFLLMVFLPARYYYFPSQVTLWFVNRISDFLCRRFIRFLFDYLTFPKPLFMC